MLMDRNEKVASKDGKKLNGRNDMVFGRNATLGLALSHRR